jgi:hypothetical protein
MLLSRALQASPLLLLGLSLGCAAEIDIGPGDYTKTGDGKADTSAEAIFVDFEFDGELLASSSWNPESRVEDQLLYTIGHLNGDRAVGRLDRLELEAVTTESVDGKTLIRYHARMPVAWGHRDDVPSSYTLRMPRDVSYAGVTAFAETYGHDCVDFGAHDVDSGSMWYYYRPARSSCQLDPADIVTLDVAVSLSDINTTGKFPEYDKVWEDDAFKVVAVFGKYEDGATTSSDAGIAGYNQFVRSVGSELSRFDVTTVPATVPSYPGVAVPEVVFTASIPGGRSVEVVAILVDNVRTAGAAFDARYAELSERADLIVYNGHAGLGANIRALATKGRWVRGQYAVVFMNGCDTYAYVDSALFDAHAAVNPDDPAGTRHLDIVTNALPSYFRSMPGATLALMRSLIDFENPKTYEQIFTGVDSSQVVLVSGEQDNEFVPGGGGDDPVVDEWEGLSASGTVARDEEQRWETPRLPAGRYRFDITGTNDADLYVRVGAAPTEQQYDCRPFKTGSRETCEVDLPAPAVLHVMVRGWASQSGFELTGAAE